MLEQIQNIIKGYAQEAVSANDNIPTEKNEAAAQAASDSVIDVLQQKLASGDLSSLLDSFKDQKSMGETGTEISNNFAQKLSGLGINMDTAKTVAMSLIPVILSKLGQSSAGSGLNVQDLLSQFSGKGGGIDLSAIGNMLGGSKDKSGKQEGGSNDLLGKLKDLF